MTEDTDALDAARACLDSIAELLAVYRADPCDGTLGALEELPLEVSVRCASWSTPHDTLVADEYRILLCTGGPAVQITGDYDPGDGPVNTCIQHQNWFTSWRDLPTTDAQRTDLLEFAHLVVGY